jgi:hypothetical protein
MEPPPFAGRHATVRRALGSGLLFFAGVLLPAIAIGTELFTKMCAQALFDPLPTLAHLALVTAVPCINLRLWLAWRTEAALPRGWVFAGALAGGVAGCYALLFLPVYPLAAIAIIFFGLGLLPFAPLGAAIAALTLTRSTAAATERPYLKLAFSGFASAVLVVIALDAPTVITRAAVRASASPDAAERARAVTMMRRFGSREVLLRVCYDTSRHSAGLLGFFIEGGSWLRGSPLDAGGGSWPTAARELYYRVTGEPYNSVAPPFEDGAWRFAREWDWDQDRGGTEVGNRLRGLSLRSSRIDGSMDADDAVAYVEWTAEFANAAKQPHEARLTFVLPPGGAVSRATLWVNGVEREAVFATREAARAAYENVVRGRRDPLLVTTNGADQVFIQMFPVPAGGSSKLRIGITAPLMLDANGRATLALPAIVNRNFSIDDSLRHAVWVEGDAREVVADSGFKLDAAGATVRRRASYTDADLVKRPRLTMSRNPAAEVIGSGKVVQTIRREPHEPAGSMFVVLDGSKHAAAGRAALLSAVTRIPEGARVGFAIASSDTESAAAALLELAPWNAERRRALTGLLAKQSFSGGEDNLGVLNEAIAALEGEPAATLLWIHGPQPQEFAAHRAALDQTLDRSARLPEIWLLPVSAGPNKLLQHPRLFELAHTRAWSGDAAADAAAAFDDYFGTAPRWTVRRALAAGGDAIKGSGHIERLWALDEVKSLVAQGPGARAEAAKLSARYQLVTPVSGALVLETDLDYVRAGLPPPDPTLVPTIPEPSTWMLLIVACLAFAWMARRQRRALA